MIAMIFEFTVRDGQIEDYLRESSDLRPHLALIDGFVSIERFSHPTTPGKFVAIGYFEDEVAVAAWRNMPEHRRAQKLGRNSFFSSYRLVMAEVLRDYTRERRDQAPEDSEQIHDAGGKRDVRP